MPYGTALQGIYGAGGGSNLVTKLYTGTGSARDIVTGQNNAGGSLVWIKNRDAGQNHLLFDTERGATNRLISDSTSGELTVATSLTSFNSNGFSLGTFSNVNGSGDNFVAWSFLQKAGFMDIVEYTGNGTSQNIAHALGTTVGLMAVKTTNASDNWKVYHTSLGKTKELKLNLTNAEDTNLSAWDDTAPTSSQFTVGADNEVNGSGRNYIAYLFAHNPSQNIFCGSFTTDGSGNATITGIGFQPKWLLAKASSDIGDWIILDIERGWASGNDARLEANTSDAENAGGAADLSAPTSDGFTINGAGGGWRINTDHIYMAIG